MDAFYKFPAQRKCVSPFTPLCCFFCSTNWIRAAMDGVQRERVKWKASNATATLGQTTGVIAENAKEGRDISGQRYTFRCLGALSPCPWQGTCRLCGRVSVFHLPKSDRNILCLLWTFPIHACLQSGKMGQGSCWGGPFSFVPSRMAEQTSSKRKIPITYLWFESCFCLRWILFPS